MNLKQDLNQLLNELKANPNSAELWCDLGNLYCQLLSKEEALNAYSQSIKFNSHIDNPSFLNRALTYLEMKRWEEGIVELNSIIKRAPAHLTAKAYLFTVFVEINDSDRLMDLIKKYSLENIYGNELAKKIIKGQQANKYWKLQSKEFHTADEYVILAQLELLLTYDKQRMIPFLKKALAIDSENSNVLYLSAWAKCDYPEFQESAIEDLKKCLVNYEKPARVYNLLGNCYGNLGQNHLAFQCYNKAIEIEPNFSLAFYNRGFELLKLNQVKEACLDWFYALQLQENEPVSEWADKDAIANLESIRGQLNLSVEDFFKWLGTE